MIRGLLDLLRPSAWTSPYGRASAAHGHAHADAHPLVAPFSYNVETPEPGGPFDYA